MKKTKLEPLVESINKTYQNEPEVYAAMNKYINDLQDMMKSNAALRQGLGRSIESLKTFKTKAEQQRIITELENIRGLYKNLDAYYVDCSTKAFQTLVHHTTAVAALLGKKSVTNHATDANHGPSRNAKKILWDEWEMNSKKYPSKKQCALQNYSRIMQVTGAKISRETFVRVLMHSKRPDL
jgi:hypothetical protein